jgi:HK97 family phage major capsid protein
MDFAKMLKALQDKRAATIAKMEELHNKANDEARTFDEPEQAAFDELNATIGQVDKQIASTEAMEKLLGTQAKPLDNTANPAGTAQPARSTRIQTRSNLPPGTAFTRYAMALAAAKGNTQQAHEIAKANWNESSPEVVRILKAAVAAGTTTDPTWASPLVEYRDMAAEFIELLRPETILGRMSGFRRVPFNVRIPRQTAGASVGWVGEGQPKPVTKLAFDQIIVPFAKVAGIVVITQELARFSSPSAEALVRTDMVATIAQFLDSQFIDPAFTGTAGVSPGSVTHDVTPIPSTGNTFDQIVTDTNAMMMTMVSANVPMRGMYWIMHPRTRLFLSTMRTAQDVSAFPGVEQGTFRGLPIIDSMGVPVDGTGKTTLTLVCAPEILLADDGQVMLDASTEAAVSMTSDGAGTTLTSLWQNNLIGIRAERFIYWLKRNAAAVAVLSGVTY